MEKAIIPHFTDRLDFKLTVLVEQITQILTDAIIEGVFKGGEQLVEMELKKKFGVSRSPLREAFRNLEGKGLVVIIPRKGTFVKTITRRDIEEMIPIRASLESLAAREAHSRMTPEVLADLGKTFQAMQEAAARKQTKVYSKHHQRFHDIFIETSGNALLVKMLTSIRMHSMWFRFAHRLHRENLDLMVERHGRMLALFEDRRPQAQEEVEEFVRRHIQESVQRFLEYWKEEKELPPEGPVGAG